jgi:hypothetical protein
VKKKLIKILKKPTGLVQFGFISLKLEKPNQTRKNQKKPAKLKKPSQNRDKPI